MPLAPRRKIALALAVGAALAGGSFAARRQLRAPVDAQPAAASAAASSKAFRPAYEVEQVVFSRTFQNDWAYWGFGAHEFPPNAPARISFESYGGIVVQHAPLARSFGAVGFRVRAPAAFGEFLKVSLKSSEANTAALPVVAVTEAHVAALSDGWQQVWVPFNELNPQLKSFDRIAIEARRTVSPDWVEIDEIVLAKPLAGAAAASRAVTLRVDCRAAARPISPLIYGVLAHDGASMGETARRIGGNPMSRLNWELGVWNTGSDWFFENVKGDKPVWEWFSGARSGPIKLAMVVPTIGWVAKDSSSVAFPISKLGPQRKSDPHRPDAGDGAKPDGSLLAPLPPTQTSVAAPPALIRRWLTKLRDMDRELGGRALSMYILDNEPSLWSHTHRDVHPEPVGYDELLQRTIDYGSVIREVDPDAVIAGPAEWGWSAYFDSAKDLAAGGKIKTDRLLHGNKPLLAWYLQQLAEHERKTGRRLLDALDVHFYPQGVGVYGPNVDPETAALRLRSTRALWDPTYEDESWIKDRVQLIPRMRTLIEENYPGRKLSLGEWSFGAEHHISGGLALAEALGRFGQHGLDSAFLWAKLTPDSPGHLAFRAFRDFDGKGASFRELSVPASSGDGVSLFVSRDAAGGKYVAVLLNLDPDRAAQVSLDFAGCATSTSTRVFGFGPDSKAIESFGAVAAAGRPVVQQVPAYSLRVLDLSFASAP